jgi:hypothetical protein
MAVEKTKQMQQFALKDKTNNMRILCQFALKDVLNFNDI